MCASVHCIDRNNVRDPSGGTPLSWFFLHKCAHFAHTAYLHQEAKDDVCILAGKPDALEAHKYVGLVLRVYFDAFQLSLHLLDAVLESPGRVLEPPLGLWLRLLHQQRRGGEERLPGGLQDEDAARARQGQHFSPRDTWPHDIFGAVVVSLWATLEEVFLGRLEEVPVHPRPKGAVLLRDVEQTTFYFAPRCFEVSAECVDGAAEGVIVWERDESDGSCSVPHLFPPREVKVSGCEGGEIPLDLLRLHFQMG